MRRFVYGPCPSGIEPMKSSDTNVSFRGVLAALSREDTRDLLRILGKLQKLVRTLVKEREGTGVDEKKKAVGEP